VEDASALGAVLMNGFARKTWTSFDDVTGFRKVTKVIKPAPTAQVQTGYAGWLKAVSRMIEK
jgi:glycerol kinase